MRCPKCQYISFSSADRCRNCGYELALAAETKPVDLPIQDIEESVGPPRDLPLFADRGGAASPIDDAPLVSAPAVPRPPLSVRRGQAAAVARRRADPTPAPATTTDQRAEPARFPQRVREDRRLENLFTSEPEPQLDAQPEIEPEQPARTVARSSELAPAPVFARLAAGIIDVLIIAAIDATVLYWTLRAVELPWTEFRRLPPVPLGLFLILLNGGYLAAFTAAGGQTIGKMLAKLRVVEEPSGRPVTLGTAVLRATAYLVSLAPAGLGFAPLIVAADRRALHDRLANTRVVRA
jgi:uncharacterized RDD family membrane protein YckC